MEIIELTLSEGTEVSFQIALVDNPAIESDFIAFNKHQQFKVISEDKRIVSGFAMMADQKIYRRDDKDGREYWAKFTSESIKNISEQFFKNNLTNQTNAMHQTDKFLEGVYVFESFLIDESRGISIPKGYGDAEQGSWFISMKVENDEVWKSVKNGTSTRSGVFRIRPNPLMTGNFPVFSFTICEKVRSAFVTNFAFGSAASIFCTTFFVILLS